MAGLSGWINITDSCNNRCRWCYAKDSLSNHFMPYTEIIKTLDWLKQVGCTKCTFIGGEPCLHPDLPLIFKYGIDQGMWMNLVTNGRCFSNIEFCEKMIQAGLVNEAITFSMHASSNQSSANLIGNKRGFSEFEKGYINLLKMGVVPDLNITLSKHISDCVDEMITWASNVGAKKLVFNTGLAAVSQKGVQKDFVLSPGELSNLIENILRRLLILNIKPLFQFHLPLCLFPKKLIDKLIEEDAVVTGCSVISGAPIINVLGEMVPCNHLLDFPIYGSGEIQNSVRDGTIKDILKTQRMEDIRKAAYAYRSEYCIACDFWGLCFGGCPIFWYYNSPTMIQGLKN